MVVFGLEAGPQKKQAKKKGNEQAKKKPMAMAMKQAAMKKQSKRQEAKSFLLRR